MLKFVLWDDEGNEINAPHNGMISTLDEAVAVATKKMSEPEYLADPSCVISVYQVICTIKHAGPPPIEVIMHDTRTP